MTVKEIIDFFGILTNYVNTGEERVSADSGGLTYITEQTFTIDGEHTTHGLGVRIVQTRLRAAVTGETVVSELRVISGHKGTEILTPDNIFNVLATHLTQL